jgi:putative SOS response-associated peptidase YedK
MCARFLSIESSQEIAEYFHVGLDLSDDVATWEPRFNLAPTNMVRVVACDRRLPTPQLTLMRWGIIPQWQRSGGRSTPLINARVETVSEKPSFRDAFTKRRCIVPMTGFYEWTEGSADGPLTASGKPKRQPHLITPRTLAMLAVAGIWNPPHDSRPACVAILTTSASADMSELHDRMPVLLNPEDWEDWMDPDLEDLVVLGAMVGPSVEGQLTHRPISTEVNSVRAEGPQLLNGRDESVAPADGSAGADLDASRTPQLFSDEFGS